MSANSNWSNIGSENFSSASIVINGQISLNRNNFPSINDIDSYKTYKNQIVKSIQQLNLTFKKVLKLAKALDIKHDDNLRSQIASNISFINSNAQSIKKNLKYLQSLNLVALTLNPEENSIVNNLTNTFFQFYEDVVVKLNSIESKLTATTPQSQQIITFGTPFVNDIDFGTPKTATPRTPFLNNTTVSKPTNFNLQNPFVDDADLNMPPPMIATPINPFSSYEDQFENYDPNTPLLASNKNVQYNGDNLQLTESQNYEETAINQRYDAISKLSNQVVEVNGIFHRLNQIVGQHDEFITDIAGNIEKSVASYNAGHEEVVKSSILQKKKSGLLIFATLVIVFVIVSVTCVIVFKPRG